MGLIEAINNWDTALFLTLNGMNNPFFDGLMYAFSDKMVWVPFYISVLYVIIKNWKLQGLWMVAALVLCIVLADQISSSLLKPLVQRPRPSREEALEPFIHLVNNYRSGRYGFVSSHAANAFGFALLCSHFFKNRLFTILIFLWAIITAYSRIYLGVHYPLDVVGGMIVGMSSAFFCLWLLGKLKPTLVENVGLNKTGITLPVQLMLGVSVLGILLYAIARIIFGF